MTAHASTGSRSARSVLAVSALEGEDWNAVDRAAWLAGRWNCRLIVLKATDDSLSDVERHAIRKRVERRIAALAPPHPPEMISGAAYSNEAITEAAKKFAAELVAMAPSVVQALSSVADSPPEAVATGARRPVLVAKAVLGDYGRGLMATDLSEACAEAVGLAQRLDLLPIERLTFLHAYSPMSEVMVAHAGVDPDELERVALGAERKAARDLDAFIEGCGLKGRVEARIAKDAPARAILDAATTTGADIIILGSSRRGGLSRFLMGSTVRDVLAGARCDVLVAPGSVKDGQ